MDKVFTCHTDFLLIHYFILFFLSCFFAFMRVVFLLSMTFPQQSFVQIFNTVIKPFIVKQIEKKTVLDYFNIFNLFCPPGTKSPDVLRKKLEDAMRRKDKRALDKAIRECVAAGMPSLDDAIQKARTVSDILGGGAGG